MFLSSKVIGVSQLTKTCLKTIPSCCQLNKLPSIRWMCSHDDRPPNFPVKRLPVNIKSENEVQDPHVETSKLRDRTIIEAPDLVTTDSRVSPHLEKKYVLFKDKDAEIILDIDEEFQLMQDGLAYNEISDMPTEQMPVEHKLERGVHVVYDIENLVTVLREENARDICVIEIPKELVYADYLVLATGLSPRHLIGTMEFVRKLYKKKKSKKDKFPSIHGEESKNWLVMDMGNIVLHMFLSEVRKKYDIETLWAVGESYDDLCNKPQGDLESKLQAHLDFLDSLKPLGGYESTKSQS